MSSRVESSRVELWLGMKENGDDDDAESLRVNMRLIDKSFPHSRFFSLLLYRGLA